MSLCVPHFIYYHYFCSPLNNFYSIKINQSSVIKTLLMHKISFELSYNTSPHYLCPSSLSSPRDWKSDLRCIPVWSAFMSYGQLYHTKETKSQTKQKHFHELGLHKVQSKGVCTWSIAGEGTGLLGPPGRLLTPAEIPWHSPGWSMRPTNPMQLFLAKFCCGSLYVLFVLSTSPQILTFMFL